MVEAASPVCGAGAREVFPAATLDALFEAVEVNDVIDPDAELPQPGGPPCTDESLRRCFSLAWQFWYTGVRRTDLKELVQTLARDGDLDPVGRRRYKHIRARCKQLRFALVLYGARHREPPLLGLMVRALGRLQDAFRCGDRAQVRRYCRLFAALLSPPLWGYTRWRAGVQRLDTAGGFRAFSGRERERMRRLLAKPRLAGREFHELRKIVSRQGAYRDHFRTVLPDEHTRRMSRFLGTVNGLMGARHDEMVRQDAIGERDYDTLLPLPTDIRQRLEALAAAWPD